MATTVTTVTPITATAPDRTQGQAAFNTNITAFLNAIKTTSTELAVTIPELNTAVGEAETAATNAEAAQTAAEAARDSAALTVGASAWVSAASYTAGDAVWSPVDFQTYRAKLTHSGETGDPSTDATNWDRLGGVTNLAGLGITASAAEINKLDGVTASTAEINRVVSLGDLYQSDEVAAAALIDLTGTGLVTPRRIADALAPVVISGAADFTPDFDLHRVCTWAVTANRVIANPLNVKDGVTIKVRIVSSTSTERTITFGTHYFGAGGGLPTVAVTDTAPAVIFLTGSATGEVIVGGGVLEQ
jgi:hypothetical protein